MSETREQKLARELSHRFSASQLPEDVESVQLPPEYGGGYYIRKKQELEAPFIDPTLPVALGGFVPKNVLSQLANAVKGYGKLGAEAVARNLDAQSPLTALAQPSFVVKPKGGNWLTGSVEDALKGLKHPEREGRVGAAVADHLPVGEWYPIHDENGAVSEYVKHLGGGKTLTRRAEDVPINSWIEGPLTKYVKTRMASPEDEVRKLAEQGVLHSELYSNPLMRSDLVRKGHGGEQLGRSALAKQWENIADAAVLPGTYESHLPLVHTPGRGSMADSLRKLGGDFAVANPESTAYAFDHGTTVYDLGFPHLIDELSNALNPASGLPRHLQLSPEAMQQLSMEKAVRRVADINAWRAAQKIEANRKLAEQASIVREYSENNPKGLRWVELKARDLPEGYKTTKEGDTLRVFDLDGREIANFVDKPEKNAAHQAKDYFGKQALADQLKYEGDTMGHCVGGYCDDVLSGRSRIFSLRDAKGEPHVTVEVNPAAVTADPATFKRVSEMSPEEYATAVGRIGSEFTKRTSQEEAARLGWMYREDAPYFVTAEHFNPSVKQIKGKQNRAPNAEYLPFVQDFVRNSPLGTPWSDVGDLGNAGLRRSRDVWNELEQQKIRDAGKAFGDYVSPEELRSIVDEVWPGQWGDVKFSSGGPVNSAPATDTLGYNVWQHALRNAA